MRVFDEQTVDSLDRSICTLHSMGKILAHLATMEEQEPDLSTLADLGRVVVREAKAALDLLGDGEVLNRELVEFHPSNKGVA